VDDTTMSFFTTRFSVLQPAHFADATCFPPLVISGIYAMGGQDMYFQDNDWVELHNREARALNLDGVALQINAGADTGDWTVVPLSGILQPGGFYLVELGRDDIQTGMTVSAGDAVGTYNLPADDTRIAITVGTSPLTGTEWDYVSGVAYFETATFTLEGTGAEGPFYSPGYILQRSTNGCTWTGSNFDDLYLANVRPANNTASQPLLCTCE
jgi:hypothetical protein